MPCVHACACVRRCVCARVRLVFLVSWWEGEQLGTKQLSQSQTLDVPALMCSPSPSCHPSGLFLCSEKIIQNKKKNKTQIDNVCQTSWSCAHPSRQRQQETRKPFFCLLVFCFVLFFAPGAVFDCTLVQQNSAECMEGLCHCQMTICALSPQPLSFPFLYCDRQTHTHKHTLLDMSAHICRLAPGHLSHTHSHTG